MSNPIATIGDFAARLGSGIGAGLGAGQAAFQAGHSIAAGAIATVSPIAGGVLGLLGLLGSGEDPPPDPLAPLERAEQAIARGDYQAAREHAREWNERLAGRVMGTLRQQQSGPAIGRGGRRLPRIPDARQLEVIEATQRIAGGRTARELLSLLDFGGDPKSAASAFLLPIGAVSPIENKRAFLETEPLPLREGDFNRRELAFLYADVERTPRGVRGAGAYQPPIKIRPSVEPGVTDFFTDEQIAPRIRIGSGGRGRSVANPLAAAFESQLERLAAYEPPRDTAPPPPVQPPPASVSPPPPAPSPAAAPIAAPQPMEIPQMQGLAPSNVAGVPSVSLAQFGQLAKASRSQGGSNVSNTGLLGGITGALNAFTGALTPIVQAGAPIAQSYLQARFAPQAPGVFAPYSGGGVSMPAGNPGVLQGTPAFVGGLDVPGFDVTAQGSADLFTPFRTTAAGTQVAKPYAAVKANGKTEWFIPAGQPTGFTKATRKRRRKCSSAPARRRRPR